MKKLVILSLLFLSTNSFGSGAIDCTQLDKVSSKETFAIMQQADRALNVLAENLEGLLTRRGALKTMIVTLPVLGLYCYFFPPEPASELLGRILNYGVETSSEVAAETVTKILEDTDNVERLVELMGEMQGKYAISQEVGQLNALWDNLFSHPLSAMTIYTGKAIDKIWISGVPFLMGAYAKKFLKI